MEEVEPEWSWGTPGGGGGRCGWEARSFFVYLPVRLLFYLPNRHFMNHKRRKCRKPPAMKDAMLFPDSFSVWGMHLLDERLEGHKGKQ